jgi:hypothetical protein
MVNSSTSVWKIILVPSLITLAVTILRLIGELGSWNEVFFRKTPGGGGAVVGIVWLAFVFAVYFAVKLQNSGESPASAGKAIGLTLLAFAVFVGGETLVAKGMNSTSPPVMLGGLVVIIASLFVMRMAWPAYWNVLVCYALAARIPVVVVAFLALRGAWGTHYDAVGPDLQKADLMTRFLQGAVVPQLTFWIAFTTILCGLFGIITVAIRKGKTAPVSA